jgi:DNA polymerase-3 subunit gamma/tau
VAFQSLYRRYRPRRFSEVRGQEHVVRALRNAVAQASVSHAYLFSGPRGTGKTSTARILAKALNCEAPVEGEPCAECISCLAVEQGSSLDVSELDAASNNGVDAMRELVARVAMAGAGRTRVYILDEVHMLTAGASNALLKTLEDPPAHVVFVLATTDPQKVLPTITSRTQALEFRLLPAATLAEHLRWVVDDAGLEVSGDAVDVAVRRGQGSARDALSALDQIVAAGGALDDEGAVDEIVEALAERDTGRALVAVAGACAAGRDSRTLAEAVLAHLRDAFLATMAPEVVSLPDAALELVADHGRRLGPAATVRALDAVGEALVAMRDAPDSRIVLEVALVRVTRPETDAAPGALLERIERLERLERGQRSVAPQGSAVPPLAPSGASALAQAPASPDAPAVPGPVPPPVPAAAAPAAAVPAPAVSSVSAAARKALGGVRPSPGAAPRPASPGPVAPVAPVTVAPVRPVTPAPAASEAGPSTEEEVASLPTREELTLAWADHVLSRLRPVVKGLFGSGRFAGADAHVATFAVPTDAMRAKCETRRGDVEAALAAHFGRPVPLELVVDTSTAAQMADGGGPGASLGDTVDLDDLRDVPDDPRSHLQRLTQAFPGAEVVEEP